MTPRIEGPADLTADWLTAAIGAGTVSDFAYRRIGTGQMSECYRVSLTYADGQDGPASVVLKVAASDPSSRQTGLTLGLYEREVRFYADVAPRLDGPIAACHHAAYDPSTGIFDLLLGDAVPGVVGDEIAGATIEQAALALTELARVHGPLLGDAALSDAEWITRDSPLDQALVAALYAGFIDRYGDQLDPAHRDVCDRFIAAFDAYGRAADGTPQGLVHGDYRLDNMIFGAPGADRPLTVVDWQTVTMGPALTDVAYFLGCALPVDVRRAHTAELLRAYHDALGPDAQLTMDDVVDGVRRQSFFGVMMSIVSPMLVERTERGDRMFMLMIARHSAHVLDTGALAVLPKPSTPEPLQPTAADEGTHPATDEALWNESWYFDFADPSQGVGGWLRLGLIPNQGHAWINVALCGPHLPTIAIFDFEAALPGDRAMVHTDDVDLELRALAPLQSYRVSLRGRAQAYDDPADLLRSRPGRPVDVTIDLVWTTVGTPYQYRLSTRYEIPCTVSGTVTADGHAYELVDVPGQRDHSWAARDWWSMDWVWSALHLDDGTHLHGLDLRIPGAPPIAAGYVQRDGDVVELQTVTARETFGDNGLPTDATLEMSPGELSATIDVRGHAPTLLTSGDGRVSRFARAWATVTMGDGRTGVGWVEWNRNRT